MRWIISQLPSTQQFSPWLGVAAIALIVVALLLRRLRRRAADATRRGLEGEMHALTHELSAMIASAESQLDARARRLEHLLHEADQRIATLHRLSSESHQTAPIDSDDGDAAPPLSMSADVDARHAQIYQLHAEGLSPQQIADQLGRPKGEVELILALRPRGRAAG